MSPIRERKASRTPRPSTTSSCPAILSLFTASLYAATQHSLRSATSLEQTWASSGTRFLGSNRTRWPRHSAQMILMASSSVSHLSSRKSLTRDTWSAVSSPADARTSFSDSSSRYPSFGFRSVCSKTTGR